MPAVPAGTGPPARVGPFPFPASPRDTAVPSPPRPAYLSRPMHLSLLASRGAAPGRGSRAPRPPIGSRASATTSRPRSTRPPASSPGARRMFYRNNSPDTLRTFSFHLHLNAFRPGFPLGRCRLGGAPAPVQRSQGSRLRLQPRRQRADHGPAGGADLALRAGQHHRPLQLPRAAGAGRLDGRWRWTGRRGLRPCRAGRGGGAGPSTSPSGIPRWWSTTGYGWEEQPLVSGRASSTASSPPTWWTWTCPPTRWSGATGVPICGDPGWERRQPGAGPAGAVRPRLLSAGAPSTRAGGEPDASAGRRTTRPRDRRPDVRPQAGGLVRRERAPFRGESEPGVPLRGRALGQGRHPRAVPAGRRGRPGAAASPPSGPRTALAWLDRFFGPFAWPQITNVHRIEGGGTEFPMMIHDGSACQGLIVHELGHNYTMGILANNEWREGWLDEGFTSFQTTLLRDDASSRATTRYSGRRAVPHRAGPGRQLRAGQPGGRTSTATSSATTSASTAGASCSSTSCATSSGMTCCAASCAPTTSAGSSSMWTRRRSRRWRRRCAGWTSRTFFGQGLHGTALVDYAVGRVESAAGGRAVGGQAVTRSGSRGRGARERRRARSRSRSG